MRFLSGALLISVMCAVKLAAAPTPRRAFDNAVAAVQASPSNPNLREKVIALARVLRPAPALPKEAERHMARGAAAFADAKTDEEYLAAAAAFEAASVAAPWWGDPYHHAGLAYEKAKQPARALAAFKLALTVDPDDKDLQSLMAEHRAEGRAEAPHSPLTGRWSAADKSAEWRAASRADGSIEFRAGAQRFVLRLDGAALSGSHLWNGREPNGRRRCPAQSSAATGAVSVDGGTLMLEYRSPERGCEAVDRKLTLTRIE